MLELSWDMLHEAISTYLRCAYPDGQVPELVRNRVALDTARPISEVIERPPFEQYKSEAPFPCTVYALRLGSAHYPHLKLEIRPFPMRHGFVFWVNTHDSFVAPDTPYAGSDRWREVLKYNQELKQVVERAWAEQRLPTFTAVMAEEPEQGT